MVHGVLSCMLLLLPPSLFYSLLLLGFMRYAKMVTTTSVLPFKRCTNKLFSGGPAGKRGGRRRRRKDSKPLLYLFRLARFGVRPFIPWVQDMCAGPSMVGREKRQTNNLRHLVSALSNLSLFLFLHRWHQQLFDLSPHPPLFFNGVQSGEGGEGEAAKSTRLE